MYTFTIQPATPNIAQCRAEAQRILDAAHSTAAKKLDTPPFDIGAYFEADALAKRAAEAAVR